MPRKMDIVPKELYFFPKTGHALSLEAIDPYFPSKKSLYASAISSRLFITKGPCVTKCSF
jgi:hypothetical protein